jgi:hypothetical protein
MPGTDNYLPHLPQLLERWVRDLERLARCPPAPAAANGGGYERPVGRAARLRGRYARERQPPP